MSIPSITPIPDINANADTDIQDSCNCWSVCCMPADVREKILEDKIRRIVMDELSTRPEVQIK